MQQTGARRELRLSAAIAALGAATLPVGAIAVPADAGLPQLLLAYSLTLDFRIHPTPELAHFDVVALEAGDPGLSLKLSGVLSIGGGLPDHAHRQTAQVLEARELASDELFGVRPDTALPASPFSPGPEPRDPAAAGRENEPGLPSRRSIVVAQAEGGAPQAPARRTPATGRPAPADVGETGGAGFKFRLGPIRLGGDLSDFLSINNTGTQDVTAHTQAANVRAGSYIWQPWFARVTANVGLATTKSNFKSDGDSGDTPSTRSNYITGGGTVNLFPLSRFPFSASYDVSDSRTSGDVIGSDQRVNRLSLMQAYNPAQSPLNMHASYDRSTAEAVQFGRDTTSHLRGALSYPIADVHRFNLDTEYSTNSHEDTGEGANYLNVSGRHNYVPSSTLFVDNYVYYAKTRIDLSSNDYFGALDAEAESFQVSSSGTWRPEEDSPLSVSGNVRYFNASNSSGTNKADFGAFYASMYANYRYSKNVGFAGNISLNQTDTNDTSSLFWTQSASATYNSDITEIWSGYYNWFANTSLTNQTGSNDYSGGAGLSAFAGHSFSRDLYQSAFSIATLNLSQSLGVSSGGYVGQTQDLSHRAAVNWGIRQSESMFMQLGASVSDSRTYGDTQTDSQQIAFNANGNLQISRYSTFSANFYLQGTQTHAPPFSSDGFLWLANGNLNYQHARFAGVPRLRYTAGLTANTILQNSRTTGNVDANIDQATYSFDQRLDYRIGRLSLQATLRLAHLTFGNSTLLFVRVNREFGAF